MFTATLNSIMIVNQDSSRDKALLPSARKVKYIAWNLRLFIGATTFPGVISSVYRIRFHGSSGLGGFSCKRCLKKFRNPAFPSVGEPSLMEVHKVAKRSAIGSIFNLWNKRFWNRKKQCNLSDKNSFTWLSSSFLKRLWWLNLDYYITPLLRSSQTIKIIVTPSFWVILSQQFFQSP